MTTKKGKSKSLKKAVVHKIKKTTPKRSVKSFKQDARQTETLIKAGKTSAIKAIRESKALELSITYMEKGVLYKEGPDGKKIAIKTLRRKKPAKSIGLKRGMILYAKG